MLCAYDVSLSFETLHRLRLELPGFTLPAFQRDLVWTPEQVLSCYDSLWRGFPLGTILLWITGRGAEEKTFVVDGQQRLTALCGIRPGSTEEIFSPAWDLDRQCLTLESSERTMPIWMSVFDRLDWVKRHGGLEGQDDKKIETALHALDRFQWTTLPVYAFRNVPAEEVCEAFRRVNLAGTPIDPDTMVKLLKNAAAGNNP